MLWIASFSCAIDFWFHSTEPGTGTLTDFSLSEFVMTFFGLTGILSHRMRRGYLRIYILLLLGRDLHMHLLGSACL